MFGISLVVFVLLQPSLTQCLTHPREEVSNEIANMSSTKHNRLNLVAIWFCCARSLDVGTQFHAITFKNRQIHIQTLPNINLTNKIRSFLLFFACVLFHRHL
jgi:hypothetical protein